MHNTLVPLLLVLGVATSLWVIRRVRHNERELKKRLLAEAIQGRREEIKRRQNRWNYLHLGYGI